jgi:hypothetical protein
MTVMQRLQDHILISLLNEKGERLAAQLSISPADILIGAGTLSKPDIYHNIESVPVTGGQVQRVTVKGRERYPPPCPSP